MNVIRVTSPEFLQSPLIFSFLDKAWAKPNKRNVRELFAGLLPVIGQPQTGVFIGEDGGKLKALAIVFLPTSPLYDKPQVFWFYCHGSAALRDELVSQIFEYVTCNGYNALWIIFNRSAKAYERLMKKIGSSRPIGQVYEVSIGDHGQQPVRRRKQHHSQ